MLDICVDLKSLCYRPPNAISALHAVYRYGSGVFARTQLFASFYLMWYNVKVCFLKDGRGRLGGPDLMEICWCTLWFE